MPGSVQYPGGVNERAHTGAAYSTVEKHMASAVVLVVLAIVSFFKLLLVATFIFVFCM